jgi:hypothetical protein
VSDFGCRLVRAMCTGTYGDGGAVGEALDHRRGDSPRLVTQKDVQDFCWYGLAVKWMDPDGGAGRITEALALSPRHGSGTRCSRCETGQEEAK